MNLLKSILNFLFDYKLLKKKEDKGKRIGWMHILFPPSVRIAILLGILLGLLRIILAFVSE